MRAVMFGLAFCLAAGTAWGGQVVRSVSWEALASAGQLVSGEVVPGAESGAGAVLRIAHPESDAKSFPLVTLESPPIRSAGYAVRGRVRYDDVQGVGYLEMWSHLREGAFFSRTLGDSGPMQRLEGSSDWRRFALPFFNREGGAPPTKLVLNLVLAGSGTVELGPLELVELTSQEDLVSVPGAWWTDREAGLLGGVAGSLLGLLGAVAGSLVSMGRAKGFVLAALRVVAVVGVGSLVLGAVALQAGQPYAVYYPLLLVGGLGAVLGVGLQRPAGRRYEQLELQRMHALDA